MNQVKAGVILSYILLGINTFAGILYTPFLVRKLGQTEFGLYSLAASIIAYLVLFDFGLGASVTRFTAKYRAEEKTVQMYEMFGMFLALYCCIALIVAASGVLVIDNMASLLSSETSVENVLRAKKIVSVLLINLCLNFPLSIFSAIATAYERFVFIKVLGVVRILLQIAIMIPLLLWGYKAVALAVLISVLNIFTLVISALYCFCKLKIRICFFKFDIKLLKEISGFSFFIFLNAIMDNLYWSSGQFILSYTSGLDAAAVYAIAVRIIMFYMSFSCAISGVLLPKIVTMTVNQVPMREVSDLFIKIGRLQFLVVGTALAFFVVFGKWFITVWAGEEYCKAYYVCVILMFALLPPLIQNTGIEILKAKNKLAFRSIIYVILSFVGVIISYFLSKKFSIIGCAAGTGVALLLGTGLAINLYYWKVIEIDIGRFWRAVFQPFVVLALCVVLFWGINTIWHIVSALGVVFLAVAFVGVVGIALWYCGMNKYEKDIVIAMLEKIIHGGKIVAH